MLCHLYFLCLSCQVRKKCDSNMKHKLKSFPWSFVYSTAFYISYLISITCLPCFWSRCCLHVLFRCLMPSLLKSIPLEVVLMRSQEVTLHFTAQFQLSKEMNDLKQVTGLPQASLGRSTRTTRSPEWNSIRWCCREGKGVPWSDFLTGKQIEKARYKKTSAFFF